MESESCMHTGNGHQLAGACLLISVGPGTQKPSRASHSGWGVTGIPSRETSHGQECLHEEASGQKSSDALGNVLQSGYIELSPFLKSCMFTHVRCV